MATIPPSFAVLGSNTGVGKTWLGVRLFEACQETIPGVRAIKPFESGWNYPTSDAKKWLEAHQTKPDIDTVCRWKLPQPVTPAEELERLHLTLSENELVDGVAEMLAGAPSAIIELAGGVASPLTADVDCARFAALLDIPSVIVTTNVLGTISSTTTAFEYASNHGAKPACVILNHRPEDDGASSTSNAKWIRRQVDAPVFEVRGSVTDDLRDFCVSLLNSD
jgi:dethiobiotin synthetase